ncbi:hypothetical protein QLX67_08540 [Balneolaceae bacterium ANBcel3]|nr:hypothetical protein [Balneolaceae bacterium ANBcel3]
MHKKSGGFFVYPPNLKMLDLASMVSLYRSRGEPRRAPSGEYFGCVATKKLVKEAKFWFGLYYSQPAWDKALTKDSLGYPLTEVEFNILGMTLYPPDDNNHRSQIEAHSGFIPQLAFLMVNDLKQFGFLQEQDNGLLSLTDNGNKALFGFSKSVFERKFTPELLNVYKGGQPLPQIEQADKKDSVQTRLF